MAKTAPFLERQGSLTHWSPTEDEKKLVCQPGNLGMQIDWDIMRVTKVSAGGQAATSGVKVGWHILELNGMECTRELFKSMTDGSDSYTITFQPQVYQLHCLEGHVLTMFSTEHARYKCGGCGPKQEFEVGTDFRGCHTCGYYMCTNCYHTQEFFESKVESIMRKLPKFAVADAAKKYLHNDGTSTIKNFVKEGKILSLKDSVAGPTYWRARTACYILYGSLAVCFFFCFRFDFGSRFPLYVKIPIWSLALVIAWWEFQSTRELILPVTLDAKDHVMPMRAMIRLPSLWWHFCYWCVTSFVLSVVSVTAMFQNTWLAANAFKNLFHSLADWLIFVPWVASWVHVLIVFLYTEQPPCDKNKKKLEYKIGKEEKWSNMCVKFFGSEWGNTYSESVLFIASIAKWPSLGQLMLSLVRSQIAVLRDEPVDRFGKVWQQRVMRYVIIIFKAYLPYMFLHTVMIACQMLGQAVRLCATDDETVTRNLLLGVALNFVSICGGDLVVFWQIRSQLVELMVEVHVAENIIWTAVEKTLGEQCADVSVKCQAVGCNKNCHRLKEYKDDPQRLVIVVSDAVQLAANGEYKLVTKKDPTGQKHVALYPLSYQKQDATNAIIFQDSKRVWKLSTSGSKKDEEYDFVLEGDEQDLEKKDQLPHKWKSNSRNRDCTVHITKKQECYHPVCEAHFNGQHFVHEYGYSLDSHIFRPARGAMQNKNIFHRLKFPTMLVQFRVYLILTILLVVATTFFVGKATRVCVGKASIQIL